MSKWRSAAWADESRLPADAITFDLKTYANTLSFWLIDGDSDEHLRQAVIAIAAGLERIDAFDVLAVPSDLFGDLPFESTPGRTAATDLRDRHRDVVAVDHNVLVNISLVLAPHIYQGRAKRFTRSVIIGLLKPYLDAGMLDRGQLSEHVLSDLEAA